MSEWKLAENEPVAGGVVGGDGSGEAWLVRWTRPRDDGDFDIHDVSVYSVDLALRGEADTSDAERFVVEAQICDLICGDTADPGGTEITSDYIYQTDPVRRRASEAEREALARVRWLARHGRPRS